jgi:crotonobetainyl-CoA:carnitine CoA-transferase CaiB-like acyl-CoA transferase
MSPDVRQTRPRYLSGLRVLELGSGIAGSAATSVLGDLGASVWKLEPAERAERSNDLLLEVLDRGKSFVPGTQLNDQLGACDVIVCDRIGDANALLPSDPASYMGLVEELASRSWVTISAYGLTGPKRHLNGSDLTIGAAGALYATDPATGSPVRLGGNQALLGAGHVAALAACHAIDLSRASNRPVHVDVSAHEAAIATGPVLRLAHAMFRCVGAAGSRRNGAPAGFYRCRDGVVRISAMENHQFEALRRAFDYPAWADAFVTPAARIEKAEELDALVAAQIVDWTKSDCEARLQAGGVPATAMYEIKDLLSWPQFVARGALEASELDGRPAKVITPPIRVAATGKTRARGRPRGLAGLRVAEAGHVLAVPLSTALLGALGAEVTKLEDPRRIDVYRRRGPYVDGTSGDPQSDGSAGLERSAYFAAVNHSKRSVALDMESDPATLSAVLDEHDVLIENLGPRRAGRLRLDSASATEDHPGLFALSSSGYGHHGPWSAYRVYAYNLHAACGLCAETRTAEGEPAEIDLAWGDLITAYTIATVVAAWAIAEDSPDADSLRAVDLSMAEVLSSRFNDRIATIAAGLDTSTTADVDFDAYCLAGDDRWVAISTHGEAERYELTAIVQADRADRNGKRLEDSRLTDELLRWVISRPSDEIVDRLQTAGLAAAVAASIDDLIADEHLAARGFFPLVEHPVWGSNRLIGLPWRVVNGPDITVGPPPIFGSGSALRMSSSAS